MRIVLWSTQSWGKVKENDLGTCTTKDEFHKPLNYLKLGETGDLIDFLKALETNEQKEQRLVTSLRGYIRMNMCSSRTDSYDGQVCSAT